MSLTTYPKHHYRNWLVVILAGAMLPLSLAPLDWWPLAILSPLLLIWLTAGKTYRRQRNYTFCYGLGYFGVGASWVFVSIHDYSNTPLAMAVIFTALFIVLLAAIFTLPFMLLRFIRQPFGTSGYVLLFASLWVLGEWLRSWLFTGFPWLYVGYSQIISPLQGWAPIGGVFLISFWVLLSAGGLLVLFTPVQWAKKLLWSLLLVSIWGSGYHLKGQNWTQDEGKSLTVALVQPNIPQEKKWQPDFLMPTLERLNRLSEPGWKADWMVWPEAAIPLLYREAEPYLASLRQQALESNTAFLTGILYDDPIQGKYYNSVIGLGVASGVYRKTRLVPFGEYVPLASVFANLFDFFQLPMSIISPGSTDQHGIQIGSHLLGTAICYEIVYPDLVARLASQSSVLLTVSNDGWFGHSWGPLQHLQMAQMRALETGRYVIRATNNGVSAIISPKGEITARTDQFVEAFLLGEFEPKQGATPFMVVGSAPVLGISSILVLLILILGRTGKNKKNMASGE